MEATTIRLVEKLMESHYGATPDFFEEDGAMSYFFTAHKTPQMEISGSLHVYEHCMELRLEYYKQGQSDPFKVSEASDISTFKELTNLIKNA